MATMADFKARDTVAELFSEGSMISEFIWQTKYKKWAEASDGSLAHSFSRVSNALAVAEANPEIWSRLFYKAMLNLELLPGGRVLAGAGRDSTQLTLFNTFSIGHVEPNLNDFMVQLEQSAKTMRMGGGIGCNFSDVPPRGSPLGKGSSVGPVGLMAIWDAMCCCLVSSDAHRGAMMAVLACDHPDIEQFVRAKLESERFEKFNLSVLITDRFMQAVECDESWQLEFSGSIVRQLPARQLWKLIIETCYESSEPGVIFIDRINDNNKLNYCERITATNSCAEQPLPPLGGAPLASINLARLVNHPFTSKARMDGRRFRDLILLGVRLLDNVIDISGYPAAGQRSEAMRKRRIGLGVTGLADALAMCGAVYGSAQALDLVRRWLEYFRRWSHYASILLAKERGPFIDYDACRYGESSGLRWLDGTLRAYLSSYGIRNSVVNAIAPAGSISLVAGNVSSGIEPIFSERYTRKIETNYGQTKKITLSSYSIELFRQLRGDIDLPPQFVFANDISPQGHILTQGMAQAFIDGAISKTVNCSVEIPLSEFSELFTQAYAAGCKSIAAYRPSELRGSVLDVVQ